MLSSLYRYIPKKLAVCVFLLFLPGGCTTTPLTTALALAQQSGASWEQLSGDGFQHLVISHIHAPDVRQLHLYIGGDGQAFHGRHSVSQDPTPEHHLALQLMLADKSPAAFIARPCYYTASKSEQCNAAFWTSARYSPDVITSVSAIVNTLAERYPDAEITLMGYSGGGVIALLVAADTARVKTVITVASPLDLDAWTQLHAYTPLSKSINPLNRSLWPADLRQIHLSGAADKNVPPSLSNSLQHKLQLQGVDATFRTLPAYDHQCCWLDSWPELLNLESQPQTR